MQMKTKSQADRREVCSSDDLLRISKTRIFSFFFTNLISTTIRSGWRIVAVEQAEESVPLQDFVFPPKTLLLLGKEREGVPVELLNKVNLFRIRNPQSPLPSQVDDCVEIPQSGLVRSFNVHVTGAVVLWEAVKQLSKL